MVQFDRCMYNCYIYNCSVFVSIQVAVTIDNIISVIGETSELATGELNTADVTYVAEILNNVVDRPIAEDKVGEVTTKLDRN